MPASRRGAAAAAAAAAASSSASTPLLAPFEDAAGDSAVLKVLAKHEHPPSLFVNPALGFKVIWALKALAARARQRVRAARAAGVKKPGRRKAAKPEGGVALLRSRLKFLGLRMKVIEGSVHKQSAVACASWVSSDRWLVLTGMATVSFGLAQTSCTLIRSIIWPHVHQQSGCLSAL